MSDTPSTDASNADLSSVESDVLKPCPFCGCGVAIEHIPAHKHELATFMGGEVPDTFYIECAGCPVGMLSNERDELVALWNRRDGDACRNGCKISKAVREFTESVGL